MRHGLTRQVVISAVLQRSFDPFDGRLFTAEVIAASAERNGRQKEATEKLLFHQVQMVNLIIERV